MLGGSAYGEDDGADVVVKARGADSLLVSLWRTGLVGKNESGTDPHGAGTEHKSSSDRLTVEETSSGHDLDVKAGEWGLLALAHLDDGWDQDGGWNISSVASSLTSLGTDDIASNVEALLDMLGVANHVHVENTGLVETLDDVLWWHTDGADEELGTAVDDNGD
jgi:hypothetical protein